MPMLQSIGQYPVAIRIPALKGAVLACRAQKEAAAADEAEWMDQLAQAEAQIGETGVEKSGLIPEGGNPYLKPTPVAPPGFQGDLVDPKTGESSGGVARTGSAASPSGHTQSQHR